MVIVALILALDLATVARIESNGNTNAVGDGGKAHGAFQMHRPAWDDVSAARAKRGDKVYAFRFAHDSKVAPIYASEYLAMLSKTLTRKLGRAATDKEVYAAYNLGLQGFAKRGYRLENCPTITQNAVKRIP